MGGDATNTRHVYALRMEPSIATQWLAWLDAPVFSLAGAPCSWAELLGALTGVACVWLVAHWMTERFVERLSEADRQWQWLRGAREA